ncbi:hypothetical protein CANTEDRAFT_115804 [Yamadazyma tenuis ATCC 10573]|uniref:6-phosphogluconolactonase-like protein n=2 Tax=Candida tenuis TaxID=2315449 RepID=G3B833_CANTC|nr:6-phosphogluconolactonase-like protein [Yamadazyma tenuis ATCC 10573]XP_006689040.1 uncharacterized protein CANTEDRAFT_115804 [Yamadazyma tenuis ATCC 10573]EGV62869.1 6-phosphogluconolactonase-like protein [Yamadazyma tenuis ATCC 10573]EGV62870.1 hypothetical protein CANTEDRAFT_115804 [Yamadazyma tenuis ATCC 10573]
MVASVYSYQDSAEVASALAKHVLKYQAKAINDSGKFRLAVSGGSLGKALKKALIDNKDVLSQVQWDKWEVYFSDERLVPLDHEDSNAGLFFSSVIDQLPSTVTKPKVITIDESLLTGKDGQVDGSDHTQDKAIAQDYEAKLPSNKKMDLVLLGCGPDGHTCSLFPGHPLLQEQTQLIAYIKDSPKPPPRRITFTFPLLQKASGLAFVAEGAGKAPILKEIFNNPNSKLPSQLVNNLDVEVAWFVNNDAINGVDVLPSKY